MAARPSTFFTVGDIRPAEDSDFEHFIELIDGGGWTKKVDKNGLLAWTRSVEDSSLKMFKFHTVFKDVSAGTAFDVLMDQDYRPNWDDASIKDFDICKLDGYNDIGYYAMKCPAPLKNRDYVNQRSWRVTPGKHYIVFNHSVTHERHPPLKNFVRAVSFVTGFVIKPAGDGSSLSYVTQSDPKGVIPKWIINFALSKVAPMLMERLHVACVQYNDWKASNNPGFKPWLHPEQNLLPLYSETLKSHPSSADSNQHSKENDLCEDMEEPQSFYRDEDLNTDKNELATS